MTSRPNELTASVWHPGRGVQRVFGGEFGCSFSDFLYVLPSSEFESFDLLKADHVVHQVRHRDSSVVSVHSYAAVPRSAHAHAHRTEDMFHSDPDAGLCTIPLALAGGKWLVSIRTFNDLPFHAFALENFFAGLTSVGTVHICNWIFLRKQVIQRLTVMHRRAGD